MSSKEEQAVTEALDLQEKISQEISKLIRNFKKDSAERKLIPTYYKSKLAAFDEAWNRFADNDKNIPAEYRTAEYLKFYKDCRESYDKYRTIITDSMVQTSSNALGNGTSSIVPENADATSLQQTATKLISAYRRQRAIADSIKRALREYSETGRAITRDSINSLWSQYQDIHFSVHEECEDPVREGYDMHSFLRLEGEVQRVLGAQTNASSNEEVHLPRVSIPKFDGDLLKWTQFFDLFKCMVHDTNMPTVRKMWYLKTSVTGEAERLIRHIDLKKENYMSAWEILVDAYNNPRHVADTILNRLLQQHTNSDDPKSLKELYITTIESLASLKGLGIDISSWDTIIIAIIKQKLDFANKALYEQSLDGSRELQGLDTMLSFLDQRSRVLGTGRRNQQPKKEQKGPTCTSASAGRLPNCPFCKRNHWLYKCDDFRNKTIPDRVNWVQKQKLCVNCFSSDHKAKDCRGRTCFKCDKKHHTLLHLEATSGAATEPQSPSVGAASNRSYNLLATVKVLVKASNGQMATFRALLDSGSQINLISERMASKLSLKLHGASLRIEGIGGNPKTSRSRANVLMKSMHNDFAQQVEAFVLPHIIADQPAHELNSSQFQVPNNVTLADPNFDKPGKIDMLIGAEHYYSLLLPNQMLIRPGGPILQNTKLGWIVAGRIPAEQDSAAICAAATTEDEVDTLLERFWTLENLDTKEKARSPIEAHCESHFVANLQVAIDGRFIVKLPFSEGTSALGASQKTAINRFLALERRTAPEVWKGYVDFMEEYERLGHMKLVPPTHVPSEHYFIPHHCVLKPESSTTKLRVVFDASCKTTTNKSLNDILYAGPTVQSELFAILLRFRTHRYVFTADIEKMYRQVWMHPDHQFHQLIVWRNKAADDLKFYRLKTVTYGTTSAPFLATKCLDYLAEKAKNHLPLGSSVLKHDFYVDDCLTGADSIPEAIQIQQELNKILLPSGFKLRKWCSNNAEVLTQIPQEDIVSTVKLDETLQHHSVKTLGLLWMPQKDQLCGRSQKSEASTITKRVVSSESSQIFDPLGLFAPVVVKAKMFMQTLWELKMGWDDELPQHLQLDWKNYRADLQALNSMQIPRHIFEGKVPVTQELHTFVDASERAYGAAVYVRATYKNNQVSVRLLCSKSRVAPSAKETLPRLELCAAVLGAELTHRVRKDLRMPEEKASGYLWTDSTVVLSWINASASSYHTFVANRIAKIQAVSQQTQWRHVSSANNPADVLSRGIAASKLAEHNLWLYGPLFLHGPRDKWSQIPTIAPSDLERRVKQVSLPTCQDQLGSELYSCNHSNSFHKLQRIVAYMMRFCNKRNRTPTTTLTVGELTHARTIILGTIQKIEFGVERKQLHIHKTVDKRSSIVSLSPIIGNDGLIRVGGRLEESNLPYNTKHQILLPYNDPIVKMLLREMHEENMHCGAQSLRAIARQQYWILNDKTMARSIIHSCVRCTRARPKLMQQIMGNLPANRVTQARPFSNSGVDYCGPIWIHHKIRGKRPDKAYIAVFCCFATKAVHLELVSDLTTDAFLAALRRFLGRRGKCQTIHCDNATNFVGANNQLKALEETIFSENAQTRIINQCSKNQVEFKFIPPRAPSFGGLWEAAVKSAKRLLVSVTATSSLTFEELNTVIIEVEAILNSRPLTPMSSDPTDTSALTPGHFLIGEPLVAPPDANLARPGETLVKRWELVSRLKQSFWNQWSMEYLQELQMRTKWKTMAQNVKEGLLVLVKEDNVPVMSWPMGRIVKTYPGKDNQVRVVDVKTASGTFKRPVTRLAPLINEEVAAKRPHNSREDAAQAEEIPTQKRRISVPILPTLLAMLLILPLAIGQSVSVTPFANKPGIFYERLGTSRMAISEWTIIVYYDLKPYWSDMRILSAGLLELKHKCSELRNVNACKSVYEHFQHIHSELQSGNELMNHSRQRRSPLDLVGNVANSLFGVLDSRYADNMSKVIKEVKSNEDVLMMLLKNQTSILDSTINIVRKSSSATNDRIKTLEYQIDTISKERGKYQGDHLQQAFMVLTSQLTLVATGMQRMQSEIANVLTDVRHRTISPILVSPKQLREQLDQIREHIPPDQLLPVSSDNVIQLYKIMHAKGTTTSDHVIFKISLPLVSITQQEVFRIMPIPTWKAGSWQRFSLKTEIIAVNAHRDQFMGLTKDEFEQCLELPHDEHICFNHQATFSVENRCEFQLFNNKTETICEITQSRSDLLWSATHQRNRWMFATHSPMELQAVCQGISSTVHLNGTGLLSLAPGCTARNSKLSVSTFSTMVSETKTTYVRFGNVTTIDLQETSEPVQRTTAKEVSLEELGALQHQLEKFKETNWKDQITAPQHHQIAAYVALAMSILLGIAWVLRRTVARWTPTRRTPKPRQNSEQTAPEPTPRNFSFELNEG